MSENTQTLTIHGVELTQPDLGSRYLPDGMTPMETCEALARIVAGRRCRDGEEVLYVKLSGPLGQDPQPVAVKLFSVSYGRRVDSRTTVDNRHEHLTITADEVATVRRWLGQPAGALDEEPAADAIDVLVERMSEDELRAAARAGIVANAWLNLYPDELDSEHRDLADEALRQALPGIVAEEQEAFVDASDLDPEIAACNWWRSLLNYVPLNADAEEPQDEPEDDPQDEPEDLVTVTVTFPDGATKTTAPLEREIALHKTRNQAVHFGADQDTASAVYLALQQDGEAEANGYRYALFELDRAGADRGE